MVMMTTNHCTSVTTLSDMNVATNTNTNTNANPRTSHTERGDGVDHFLGTAATEPQPLQQTLQHESGPTRVEGEIPPGPVPTPMVVPDYAQQLSSQRLAVSMLPGIEQSPSWNWIQSPQVLLASNQGFLNSYPHIQLLPSVSHDENLPTFRYKQNTLAALMLSTILACFSAFDAKNQCRSEAGYDVHEQFLDNYDDNDNSANGMDDAVSFQDERFACLQMFRVVIIPVGVMVLSLCIICLWVLWRHQRSLETMLLVTTNTKMDFCEHNYRTCRCLALPIAVITLSWIYGTVAIMLRPRLYQGSGDTNNGNSNEE